MIMYMAIMNHVIPGKNNIEMDYKKLYVEIIQLVKNFPDTIDCRIIGGQIIKSCTSAAANYRAALRARSSAEFYAKLCIVVEEIDETLFWLEMIQESGINDSDELKAIKEEATELLYIFSSSRKTAKIKK